MPKANDRKQIEGTSAVAPLARWGSPAHAQPMQEAEDWPYVHHEEGEDSEALQRYWQVFWRNKWKLAAFAIAGAALGYGVTTRIAPVYRATTVLEIQSLNEDFLNRRSVSPNAAPVSQSPEYMLRTEAKLLQSRPVLERVLNENDIANRLLAAQKTPALIPWLQPEEKQGGDGVPPKERALAILESGLAVRNEPTTRVVEVQFDAKDAALSADVANAVTQSFIRWSQERRTESSKAVSETLGRQLDDVKARLQEFEYALRRQAASSNMPMFSGTESAAEARLRQMQLEISAAQAERAARQSQYEQARLGAVDSLPAVVDDSTLKEYQVQLTDLRKQLAELSSSLTQEHPRVVKIRAQIGALEAAQEKYRANIVARIRNDYESARRRESLLVSDYAAQLGYLAKHTDKLAQYQTLKQDVDTTRQLYDSLFQRVREAGLATAMQASNISVIEPALAPRRPVKPSRSLNMFVGLMFGLCVGGAWSVRRAKVEQAAMQPGELSYHLNMPELGVIPSCVDTRSRLAKLLKAPSPLSLSSNGSGPVELTTWESWPSAVAESFRCALASILLAGENGKKLLSIAITSATPGEGKTSISCNLAVALARINRRVLLIDGDLRRPRLHDIFQVDNTAGFAEMLEGTAANAVKPTMVPNLFVLPSGTLADERVLFSKNLSALLARFRLEYDMVLIDTPPILQMSDARLISRNSDATILVVAQHAPREAVLHARHYLWEDRSNVLGTILNHWNPQESDHPYSKYGYASRAS